jgi:type I restriction enzyme, S subunit
MKNHQLSIKKYPLHKDSGIDWLGNVPNHWNLSRIKSLTKTKSGTTPKSGTDEYYENGTYFWVRTTDINNDRLYSSEFKVTELAIRTNNLTFIKPKSILLAMYGGMGTIGKNAMLEVEVTINQSVCAIFPNNKRFDSEYLWYYVQFFRPHWEIFADSARKDPNINQEAIKRLWVILPPLPEQKAIANYLDTKTAQCDRKIDLLTQKATLYGKLKQSLINETVTRGLDKSVPMKDSGIEWIGEIPKHWEVKRLKNLAQIKTGSKDTINSIENGKYPFFVRSQTIERINSYSFDGEAILTAGDGVGVGKVFHYINGKFDYHQRVYKISHFRGMLGIFLFYYMRSNFYKEAFRLNAKATVDSLRMPMFDNFPVVSGSKEEQKAIADYLDSKTAQIDQIIQSINTQIEKLKELRKTLINDVVTGKIKVIGNEQ